MRVAVTVVFMSVGPWLGNQAVSSCPGDEMAGTCPHCIAEEMYLLDLP